MKKVFILVCIVCVSMVFSQKILIEKSTIDYGKVKKGSNGEMKVEVKNTGDKPLIIKEVISTCGCTIPSKPNAPILPGKTSFITLKYDTNIVGQIIKSVEVFSNDPKQSRIILRLRGEVTES